MQQLRQLLSRIDGRGYKAYKQIQGTYDFPGFTLFIDHVQGDPFALPSKIRLRVAQSQARIPGDLWPNFIRKTALEDFIARAVRQSVQNRVSTNKGSGKSGLVFIDAGRQEVLERTAIVVSKNWIEARMQVGLPANGRRILGKQAVTILCDEIPKIVDDALCWDNFKQEHCLEFLDCVENQEAIRRRLDELNLVAFIANGAVLPRKSGINDQPLSGDSVV
ncbi:MAG: ABC-ATPase domain-containing protein, partial [Candidatus Neomarinimicrobiota bacterium]|nr:ABC-ATPase domain-containing protein [Candidatus Neomarinimicrobiota bacterium]